MHKVVSRGILAVAFLGLSLASSGLQGISIQSFEPFGGAHTAEARMKADPTPKHCYLEFDKWYCVLE